MNVSSFIVLFCFLFCVVSFILPLKIATYVASYYWEKKNIGIFWPHLSLFTLYYKSPIFSNQHWNEYSKVLYIFYIDFNFDSILKISIFLLRLILYYVEYYWNITIETYKVIMPYYKFNIKSSNVGFITSITLIT